MRKLLFLTCFIANLFVSATAQLPVNPKWTNGFWHARWIADPVASGTQFGVYHFRKTVDFKEKPGKFIIHVTADNRYRLFVNGKSIGTGPARSDLANWNFETYDISPFLKEGTNVIAATVWNFGEYRPYSQISFETGFLLQGETDKEEILNTNKSWKVYHNKGYAPLPVNKGALQAYFVTAEGEAVQGDQYPWGFEQAVYTDTDWPQAKELWYGAKSRSYGTDGNWHLVPRSIPLLEETKQKHLSVREKDPQTGNWGKPVFDKNNSYLVPANSNRTYLIDQGTLTNAYPVINLSGGKNARIRMSYAEALFDSARNKGNRNVVDGKHMIGFGDEYTAEGGKDRSYSPLFFRTYRYLLLEVTTAAEAITINDLYSYFTGYPFQERATFNSDQPLLKEIWNTGWRTARLCAADSYFDCPYYEQLQYVGDTRIQAMISLYVSGDDRLMRKAITDLSHSFIPEGLTQSRYPSRDLQVIPTFSLWWVCMIHDYWMHRTDDAFVKAQLKGVKDVLGWYQQKLDQESVLGPLSWWQFTDWSWPWKDSIELGGVPPGASHGGSSIISLQYAYTLQRAAALFRNYGMQTEAIASEQLSSKIRKAVVATCWDPVRKMLADTKAKTSFSQHANIMAVLTDAIPAEQQGPLLDRILAEKNITQATYYFRFYLFEALQKTGKGDLFIPQLKPWEDMLQRGLSTFAEEADPTRSDCHAWSASPNYELLSLVCGVRPSSPGFKTVTIRPALGEMKNCKGVVPVANGLIEVEYTVTGNNLAARITLPKGTTGKLVWKSKTVLLHEGTQSLEL